jgi:hypothetical protein
VTNYDPTQPRLLADFAAAPTKRERRGARTYWRAAQCDLFAEPAADPEPHELPACAVCASTTHEAGACPHGTAPTLLPEHYWQNAPTQEATR